jgi:hypothetical protein
MIDQSVDGINKLAGDTGVLMLAPILFLCFGLANAKLPYNRRDSEFRKRLVLTLAVLFFPFATFTVAVQDRVILIGLWQEHPVLYSLVYSIGSALGAFGLGALIYWELRPKLWRRNHSESDE